MEPLRITVTDSKDWVELAALSDGGAELWAEDHYVENQVVLHLTHLELVALRDWLIAYTG